MQAHKESWDDFIPLKFLDINTKTSASYQEQIKKEIELWWGWLLEKEWKGHRQEKLHSH